VKTALLLIGLLFLGIFPAQAQNKPGEFVAQVNAPNAWVRSGPSEDAEAIASVFMDDPLLIVGRNLDGTWFEVRRPGRLNNLGWLHFTLLRWDFPQEQVPLTDLTTGLTGDKPLESDPGYAVYMLVGAQMLRLPFNGAPVGQVPYLVTIPVRARNQNGTWLLANYMGTEGWIPTMAARKLPDVMALPEQPGLPPISTSVLIIPRSVQIGEIEKLRSYVNFQRDFTFELEGFWSHVFNGDIMPCSPPQFVTAYQYESEQKRAFPELEYLVPRLGDGLDYVNHGISLMADCGVVNPKVALQGRDDAINARVVFDAMLGSLDNLEETIKNR
jgi:hypothetical protein